MMPKLLLADDSITVQRVIALTFQGEGIEVIAVGDGDLAVAAIDCERPQIVLADLSMPGRDGYAVAEYIKRSPELSKDIRVVLLTGAAEPVEEARSRDLGIDGVLSKPFEPHVATALVRRLLAEPPTVPGFRTVALEGAGPAETPAAVPPPLPAAVAVAAATEDNVIAVDDYFRRLDEALATAGLSTAPDAAGDVAVIVPAARIHRLADPATMVVARPAAAAESDDADAPKLVDAFSALLAAEEGDGAAFVAGPIEMDGAPAPVPPPAVEWTAAPTPAAPAAAPAEPSPVEAAAETVAFHAVSAEAAEAAVAELPIAVEAPAAVEPPTEAEVEIEVADASAATVMIARPLPAVTALPAAPATAAPAVAHDAPAAAASSPAALRADVPEHSALDGVDLDVFADAVAQKILHRLTDARIDAIVSERVLEIAERLVREEIERIKADAQ